MKNRKVKVVKNFYALNAAELVERCHKFDCEITLTRGLIKVNGKSLMGVISLALRAGDEITVGASGPEAAEALEAAVKILSA